MTPWRATSLVLIGTTLLALVPMPSAQAASSGTFELQMPSTTLSVPSVLKGIYEAADAIKLHSGATSSASTTPPLILSSSTARSWWQSMQNGWDNTNAWLKREFGLSLQDILKFIAGIFIWIFKLLIGILEWISGKL